MEKISYIPRCLFFPKTPATLSQIEVRTAHAHDRDTDRKEDRVGSLTIKNIKRRQNLTAQRRTAAVASLGEEESDRVSLGYGVPCIPESSRKYLFI